MQMSAFGSEISQFLETLKSAFNERFTNTSATASSEPRTEDEVQAAILAVLTNGQKNADEIAAEIGRVSAGLYRPETSVVHLALNRITEAELAKFKLVDAKKSYKITEAGQKWLAKYESAETSGKAKTAAEAKPAANFASSQMTEVLKAKAELAKSATKLGQAVAAAATAGSKPVLEEASKIAETAAKRIFALLGKAE